MCPTSGRTPRDILPRPVACLAMGIARRLTLALPLLAILPRRSPGAEPLDGGERTVIAGVAVPAARARRRIGLRLGGAEATLLAFAADLPEGERDLLAVAADGRVVA